MNIFYDKFNPPLRCEEEDGWHYRRSAATDPPRIIPVYECTRPKEPSIEEIREIAAQAYEVSNRFGGNMVDFGPVPKEMYGYEEEEKRKMTSRNPASKSSTIRGFNPIAVGDVEVKPMVPVKDAFVPSALSDGKDHLPGMAQKEIPRLLDQLRKSRDMLDYGKEVSIKISSYADKMIDHVKLVNVDDFAKPLTDVLVLCTSVNSKSMASGGGSSKIPFLKRIKDMFATQKVRAMSQFNSVKEQIDAIIKSIDAKEGSFRNLIVMLEDLYVLNMNDYYMLEAHIRAAEMFKTQKEEEYQRFMQNNAEALKSNPLLAQTANDIQRTILKVDRKLHDLRAIQVSCVQFAPQIRQEQDTTERLIEKYSSIKTFAIPLWKKQCAAYISSLENQAGVALANKADKTTDTLYRGHMDTVNKNALSSAKALENGIISVDTLEYANDSLVQSIKDVLGVVEEGTKARQEAIPRFNNMKETIYTNVIAVQNAHTPVSTVQPVAITEREIPTSTNEWNKMTLSLSDKGKVEAKPVKLKITLASVTEAKVFATSKGFKPRSAFDTESFIDPPGDE